MGSLDSRVHVGERSVLNWVSLDAANTVSWITPAQFGSERRPVSYISVREKASFNSRTRPGSCLKFGRIARRHIMDGGNGLRGANCSVARKKSGRPGPAIFVGSQAITFDKQGSLWITSLGGGIRRVPYPEHLHQSQTKSPSAWQFHNSEIEAFTQKDGLTSDYIYSVLEDREGNVWIGTSGGLDRFRESPVVSVPLQPISYRGALPIPSLNSFTTSALAAGDQGALWAAGIGPQLLLKIQKDKIATQLRDHPIECAYRDPNGVVWLATPYVYFPPFRRTFGYDWSKARSGHLQLRWRRACRAGTDTAPTRSANSRRDHCE